MYCPHLTGGAAFFTDAALLIGLQIVRTWSHGDTPYQQVTLAVMFDSTHFLHGTHLAVSILGHDNYGREYFASNTSVVSNFARCWTYPDFMEIAGGAGGDIARDMLEAMNYDASHECGFWDRQTFCDNLSGSVQYVNSHGGWDGGLPNRYHTAGIGGAVWALLHPSSPYSYVNARMYANGNGLPPYNTTSLPPIDVMLNECCDGGDDESFWTTSLPMSNAYVEFPENQAVHACTVKTLVEESEQMAYVQIDALAKGKSVLQMRGILMAAAENDGIYCKDTLSGPLRKMSLVTDQTIINDIAARSKNVYTGSTGDSEGWYREL